MTNKSETLKEIENQLAMAKHHRRVIMSHARNVCWALGLKWEGPDTKDVEDCAFGRITLEEMLEQAYGTREGERRRYLSGVTRPKEFVYRGFYMNPDGLRAKPMPRTNVEYKMTTRSASTLLSFDTEYPHWVWQSAGYSLAMKCMWTEWFVLCIGRAQLYKTDPWKPARLYKVTREFQVGEREHHFETVVRHLDVMKKNGMMVQERQRL